MSFIPARGQQGFGRRSVLGSSTPFAQRPARQPRMGAAQAPQPSGQPLIARYNWKIALVGASTLVFAFKCFHFAMNYEDTSLIPGERVALQFVIAGILAVLIGTSWLWRGIRKSTALTSFSRMRANTSRGVTAHPDRGRVES